MTLRTHNPKLSSCDGACLAGCSNQAGPDGPPSQEPGEGSGDAYLDISSHAPAGWIDKRVAPSNFFKTPEIIGFPVWRDRPLRTSATISRGCFV